MPVAFSSDVHNDNNDNLWSQNESSELSSDGGRRSSQSRRGRPKLRRIEDNVGLDLQSAALASVVKVPLPAPKDRPDANHHLKVSIEHLAKNLLRRLPDHNPLLERIELACCVAKISLQFTYGVNAWKHWVVGKNAELEKARARGNYIKPFETDLLKLRADELNYTLCLFVKEVRKPNGDSYAPDSVLYLAYGIQEYLFENGRIDNIFTDQYYETFTSALHEVVKDFKLPMNDLGYYVTRIEEEHLWEARQLGAHSPQVLLNTLVYFNTKYFMLRSVEEHLRISFTYIMKHWRKPQVAPTGPAATARDPPKSVALRYYPPARKSEHFLLTSC